MSELVPKFNLEIRPIVMLTVDEEAFLVRENVIAPWKRMTRQEIDTQYPGAFDRPNAPAGKDHFNLPREPTTIAEVIPLSFLPPRLK